MRFLKNITKQNPINRVNWSAHLQIILSFLFELLMLWFTSSIHEDFLHTIMKSFLMLLSSHRQDENSRIGAGNLHHHKKHGQECMSCFRNMFNILSFMALFNLWLVTRVTTRIMQFSLSHLPWLTIKSWE